MKNGLLWAGVFVLLLAIFGVVTYGVSVYVHNEGNRTAAARLAEQKSRADAEQQQRLDTFRESWVDFMESWDAETKVLALQYETDEIPRVGVDRQKTQIFHEGLLTVRQAETDELLSMERKGFTPADAMRVVEQERKKHPDFYINPSK